MPQELEIIPSSPEKLAEKLEIDEKDVLRSNKINNIRMQIATTQYDEENDCTIRCTTCMMGHDHNSNITNTGLLSQRLTLRATSTINLKQSNLNNLDAKFKALNLLDLP